MGLFGGFVGGYFLHSFNAIFVPRTYIKAMEASLIIIIPWELFTSVSADGLSEDFRWQQVFSSLQDSTQYSGRSQ